MKISLRKANALQQSIMELIRNIQLTSHITINEFESIDNKLLEARTNLILSATAIENLYYAFYSIRGLVGMQNAEQVSPLLTNIAMKEKQIQLYTTLSSNEPQVDREVLKGKLDKIRNAAEPEMRSSVYSRATEVSTNVLTQKEIDAYKAMIAQTKKEKQKLQDKILELNISTQIELPSDVVKTLTDADLI